MFCRHENSIALTPPDQLGDAPVATSRLDLPKRILRETGQTMSEYAVVLGVITVAAVAMIGLLSSALRPHFESVASAISGLIP